MNLKHKLRRIKIKILYWEYWPMWLIYLIASFQFLYLSIKYRSFLFFSASNPGIEFGGMCYESKWKLQQILPKNISPKTTLIIPEDSIENIADKCMQLGMNFPMIAKPDFGGKGWGVVRLENWDKVFEYQSAIGVPFLLQEAISFSEEYGIFYCRLPNEPKGKITGITGKSFLSVTGNGIKNIGELISENDRSFLQRESLKLSGVDFSQVLPKGENKVLVPYGNHSRGAAFQDLSAEIDEDLENVFHEISTQIPGFFYGRFDIMTSSLSELKKGERFFIIELNGSGAEPTHIYDPSFAFWKGQLVIFNHFKSIAEISKYNKRNGIQFVSIFEFIKGWKKTRQYKKRAIKGLYEAGLM